MIGNIKDLHNKLRAREEYDYILIDCMPSLGMLTINALAASDSVLIPVQPAYLSAKGLQQLLQTVIKVKRKINSNLEIEGILFTRTRIPNYASIFILSYYNWIWS